MATAAVAACGTKRSPIAVTTRDSSGVTILAHPADALTAVTQYHLSSPIASVGGANVDMLHDATAMRSAVFLDPDHFVVIDGRMNRLVLFDSTGTVQAIYGGRGGTDSLVAPSQLHVDSSGVWLVDLPAHFIQLGPDIQRRADRQIGPKAPVSATVLFVHGDTAIAVEAPFEQSARADTSLHRGKNYLVRLRPDGIDTLASWPGTEWFALTSGEGGDQSTTTQPVRFGPATVVRAWGDRIVVGTGDDWTLQVRDSTGALREVIKLPAPLRPLSRALSDSIEAQDLGQIESLRGADQQTKAMAKAAISAQRFADSVAPYDDAIAARDGRLWVSETALPTDSVRHYAIFGADGHLAGRLTIPASSRVLAADGERAVVRRVAADGTPYLDLARIVGGH